MAKSLIITILLIIQATIYGVITQYHVLCYRL